MGFFELGSFRAHSGQILPFKLNCDFIPDSDIEGYARYIGRRFRFSKVYGIPQGGLRLAKALEPYASPDGVTLIVDDVFTTGKSMEAARKELGLDSLGVVLYARGEYPAWIFPFFQTGSWVG